MFRYYQKAAQLIRSRWKLFLAILIMQILTLVAFTAAGLNYEVKIIQDIQGITIPLQQANYDPQSLDAGQPFIKDWWQVQRSYEALRGHVWQLIGIGALLFIVFQGGLWLATHRLVEQYSLHQAGRYLLWFAASAFLAFIPAAVFSFFVIKKMMFSGAAMEMVVSAAKGFCLLGILLYYVALLAWALLPKYGWKHHSKNWWHLLQKTPSLLPVGIINALLLSGGGYLFYWVSASSDKVSWLMLSGLLLTTLLVITRLAWIITLSSVPSSPLSHETRHP